jgi:hypothetical protein
MFAIRSGWLRSPDFSCTAVALIKPVLAKLGSVQPIRQATTAIHSESPVASTALNVCCRKLITSSLYPSILQNNLFCRLSDEPTITLACGLAEEVAARDV